MSTIKSYSSVTVIDQMDLGNIQSYLTSNQPLSVIYNPTSDIYTPDWSSSYLVITPVINYNGSSLPLTTTGLTIRYTRKDGSSSPTALTNGEFVSDGVLTVEDNMLANSASGIITYICNISYLPPNISTPITSQNTITFTKMSSASQVKAASISGQSAFLYDASRNIIGASSITLTADVQNVAVSKWQYLHSSGYYTDYPEINVDSINEPTLTILASERDIWVNGRTATIKLVTTDPNIYDIHQITKIYDGAAGSATVSVVLSNQSHYVPCDGDGNVLSFNGAATQVYIYEGGEEVTSEWTITYEEGSVSGSFADHIYLPTDLTADTGYVDFTCTREGYDPLKVRYTITKSRAGADGQNAVIYELSPSTYVLNRDIDGNLSPTDITFQAFKKEGESLTRNTYEGRFMIMESTDGMNYPNPTSTSGYQSGVNESSRHYAPSNKNVKSIKCRLYAAGGFTTLLDEQTVVITRDGDNGINGENGISAGLSNYQDVIPCNEKGYAQGARDIAIPFYAYGGVTRLPVTATVTSALPGGVSVKTNTAGTTTSDGLLVLHIDNGESFCNQGVDPTTVLIGEITIRLSITYDTEGHISVMNQIYTWTKNVKAIDGTNTHILQIYSTDGGVIRNSEGSTTLEVRYLYGSSTVTPETVQWYKLLHGEYQAIAGATRTSYTVTAADVEDYAFYRATATYQGITCEDYYNVDDVSDPIVVSTLATVREFIDGEGCGAVFTRVYRNGIELDPIKATVFSQTPPSNPKSGDYYYHLNSTAQSVTLRQFNGQTWDTAQEGYMYKYTYYKMDKNGKTLNVDTPIVARCVYIDPNIVGDTMQFICEVE